MVLLQAVTPVLTQLPYSIMSTSGVPAACSEQCTGWGRPSRKQVEAAALQSGQGRF